MITGTRVKVNSTGNPAVAWIVSILFLGSALALSIMPQDTSVWGMMASAFSLVVTSAALSLAIRDAGGDDRFVIPLFLALAASNPAVFELSAQHVVAPVLVFAIWYMLRAQSEGRSGGYMFNLFFILGVASPAFPPMIFLIPVFFATGLVFSNDKSRYCASLPLALLASAAALAAVIFVLKGPEAILTLAADYLYRMFQNAPVSLGLHTVSSVKYIGIIVLAIIVICDGILFIRRLKIGEANLAVISMVVFAFVLALAFLYSGNTPGRLDVPVAAVLAILCSNTLTGEGKRMPAIIVAGILALVVIAERVFCFFPQFMQFLI